MTSLFLMILTLAIIKVAAQEVAVKHNAEWSVTIQDKQAAKIFKQFFPDFDGQNFEIMEMDDKYYLFSEGAHKVYRFNLDLKETQINNSNTSIISSKMMLIIPATNLMAESCTGDKCTKCSFASGGGCACSGAGGGLCNHTITK